MQGASMWGDQTGSHDLKLDQLAINLLRAGLLRHAHHPAMNSV
jgi:hypothetical protein